MAEQNKNMNKIRNISHWLLLLFIAAYIITGLGITEYQAIGFFTLGLLTKNLSFQIHNLLLVPFLILLAMHLYFVLRRK